MTPTPTPAAPVAATFLTPRDVCREVGICKMTLYRWIARGLFPPPMRLGQKKVFWRQEDIDAHLAKLAAQREAEIAARRGWPR